MESIKQICTNCMKVKLSDGAWVLIDFPIVESQTSSLCPECSRIEISYFIHSDYKQADTPCYI
jgi:hypothetical protein